jgi:hypothetical protein
MIVKKIQGEMIEYIPIKENKIQVVKFNKEQLLDILKNLEESNADFIGVEIKLNDERI